MWVGGGLAGEVPGVEFCHGGVDVVGVEHDERNDPLVGVDLGETEELCEECVRSLDRGARSSRA